MNIGTGISAFTLVVSGVFVSYYSMGGKSDKKNSRNFLISLLIFLASGGSCIYFSGGLNPDENQVNNFAKNIPNFKDSVTLYDAKIKKISGINYNLNNTIRTYKEQIFESDLQINNGKVQYWERIRDANNMEISALTKRRNITDSLSRERDELITAFMDSIENNNNKKFRKKFRNKIMGN